MLEVGVPGSMDEGQMEGSGVFRAGSTACLASKSCLAKNNVKTRLPPGCLTRLDAGPRLGGSPTQRASGVSTFPKQLGPEDPEGGGLRRGHGCMSGSQSGLRISSKRSAGNLSEMHILTPGWVHQSL